MIHVLVADDDQTTLYLLRMFCRERNDVELHFALNGEEAIAQVQRGQVDILITDLRMPVVSGDELLTAIKKSHAHIPVIVMTGYGSIEGAVDYLHRGADDYLTKPLTKDVFVHRLERVMERVALSKEVQRLRDSMEKDSSVQFIGRSPKMLELKRQLPTLAQVEASVVIFGDSGTGKEVVARTLHQLSRRADRPFVAVNCGALPETLLESELFGHRRGAFTDAHSDVLGLVDAAHTGSLFLDEIGEISPGVQVKLLRFLESKEYKALGSPKTKIADVRIIAATNRDLRRAVEEKQFREDLYYRLNIVPIHLPPLKERPEDIALLAGHFVDRTNRQLGRNVQLLPEAYRKLESYAWPGNVRELENKIEQLVVMCQNGIVRAEDVTFDGASFERSLFNGPGLGAFVAEKKGVLMRFEREYLTRILTEEQGHVTRAAERAGIDRKNLWQLMRRHGLLSEDFKPAKMKTREAARPAS